MAFSRHKLVGYDRHASYSTADHTVAEVMEPGFIKARTLNLHDEVNVFASDGAIKAYVSGFMPTGEPILSEFLSDVQDSSPKRSRPPKVADAA